MGGAVCYHILCRAFVVHCRGALIVFSSLTLTMGQRGRGGGRAAYGMCGGRHHRTVDGMPWQAVLSSHRERHRRRYAEGETICSTTIWPAKHPLHARPPLTWGQELPSATKRASTGFPK